MSVVEEAAAVAQSHAKARSLESYGHKYRKIVVDSGGGCGFGEKSSPFVEGEDIIAVKREAVLYKSGKMARNLDDDNFHDIGNDAAETGTRHRILVNSSSSGLPVNSEDGTQGPSGSSRPASPPISTTRSQISEKHREGPSSRSTVLIIAGFFVVGLIFLMSGIIVVITEEHYAFIVCGTIFIAVGVLSFVICIFLQQKNLKKFVRDWEQDLYFLNVREHTKLLRSFFSFDNQSSGKVQIPGAART